MKQRVPIPPAHNGGAPLLSHIAEPLEAGAQICEQTESIQQDMSNRILELWNQEQAANASLRVLLSDAEKLAAKALMSPSDDPSAYFFVGDTFDGDGQLDSSTTAYLDREAGYMVLPVIEFEDLTPFVREIKVLEESQGRPGDYVTARGLTFDKDNRPVVEVSQDPHSQPEDLIDGRPDTWFTWEKIIVQRVQPVRRTGPANAIIADPNGKEEDLQNVTGGHNLIWRGIIPGIGQAERPMYDFSASEKELYHETIVTPAGKRGRTQTRETNRSSRSLKNAKLVLEFTFTDPVPLSAVRITPFIEQGLPEPRVESISVHCGNGATLRPPGLPRKITAISGRQVSVERATRAKVGRADYSGSGVFFVRNQQGAVSVRIELSAAPAALKLGAAHVFYVKNTETKEQAHIIGIRTKNKTRRGQERIDGPKPWEIEVRNTGNRPLLQGPLRNYFDRAVTWAQNKIKKDQEKKRSSKEADPSETVKAPSFIDQPNLGLNIRTGNKTIDSEANQQLSKVIANNSGFVDSLRASQETAKQLGTVAQSLIKGKIGGQIGSFLGGPWGIVAGAALSGNLYRKTKTTQVLSHEQGTDLFAAERAAILLREIAFDSRTFSERGEVDSIAHVMPTEARAVSLSVQADVPQEWPDGPWITAKIKPIHDTEEGQWLDIRPMGAGWSADPAPEMLLLDEPAKRFKVRITLQRPPGNEYINQTPILNSYVLKGLPK